VTEVSQLIRDEVRELSAYHVPNPGDAIKLDAMENPYAWPAALPGNLAELWAEGLQTQALNRYPDPAASALSQALAEWMGLPALANADELDIVLGNGSDELIQLLAMAVKHPQGGSRACILAPEPGFVMYGMIAKFVNADYVGVPLAEGFELDLPAMLAAIETHQPALIFLAYPNNPTGNLWSQEDLQAIVEAAPGLVVIDEAYTAFAADSRVSWLQQYPQLLVMRTLSKVGLAGLRLGMLAGQKKWLHEINKIRLPYNINSLTQYSASFALQHMQPLTAQAGELKAQRARLFEALAAIKGLTVWSSEANFLLFRLNSADAVQVHQSLAEQGVLIKKLHGAHPQLEQCLRVTVGTAAENQRFLEALAVALASS
jgi:histidinol-phosphate aminotransferase